MRTATWRYYREFYRGAARSLIIGIGATLAQSGLLVPLALLIRHAFDVTIPAHDVSGLLLIVLLILALYLTSVGSAFYGQVLLNRTVKRAMARLRADLLEVLLALPRTDSISADLSERHAEIVQDTDQAERLGNVLLGQIIPNLLAAVALTAVLLTINPVICLVIALGAIPYFVADRLLRRTIRPQFRQQRLAQTDYSAGVLFLLRGFDLIRTQTAERQEAARQRLRIANLERAGLAATLGQQAWISIQDVVMMLVTLLVLTAGGIAVATGQFTTGGMLAAFVVLGLLRDYLRAAFAAYPQVIGGYQALGTLHMLARSSQTTPYMGTQRIAFSGTITTEQLTFGYTTEPLLRDLDLTIGPRGAGVTAIVGPSGVGKSTILYLILGLHRPQEGQLLADGVPYEALDLTDLRRQIGLVPQDPIIFHGTVSENIAYGTPDAPAEAIEQAARLANAHDFIVALPARYDTLISDDGMSLSGGQRQRLAIARALLRQPALLLLDEPTTHLDSASIRHVMALLATHDHAPAIVLVSHDQELVSGATTILELREGQLIPLAAPLADQRIPATAPTDHAGD